MRSGSIPCDYSIAWRHAFDSDAPTLLFELPRSALSDADPLSRLLMLLAAATIIAISVAIEAITQGALNSIDWHAHRGLSCLQIGLRRINQLCYQRLPSITEKLPLDFWSIDLRGLCRSWERSPEKTRQNRC